MEETIMSNDNKEVKKEELLEKQGARKLSMEELEQVTGGVARINERDVATIISTVKFDTSEIKF